MKYQILRFQSEQEFQNFFGQLASAEIPEFQAVDGSSGDGGFDGISGTTAYQVYYPEDKNRTDKKYINKIDTDVAKVIESSKKLELPVSAWIFIIPEDLRVKVIAHLRKKSQETGMLCLHWGATKLTELVSKHPHIQSSFPNMFLPPVQEGIKDIKKSIVDFGRKDSTSYVEIITDDDFVIAKDRLREDFNSKVKSYYCQGRPSRLYLQEIVNYENDAEDKYRELRRKKERSDKAFELEMKELEAEFEKRIRETNDGMAKRGIFNSGIRLTAIGEIEAEKKRAIERLKLTYGKNGFGVIIDDKLLSGIP